MCVVTVGRALLELTIWNCTKGLIMEKNLTSAYSILWQEFHSVWKPEKAQASSHWREAGQLHSVWKKF